MAIMDKIRPVHPGEHLAEFLGELNITQYRLAKTIHVHQRRINEIVHGRRAITADTAMRLGRALGTSARFWLNLQQHYDLRIVADAIDVETIEPLVTGEKTLACA